MSGADEEATVLVVDDEEAVADTFALQLDGEYDVRTAYGGEEALEAIDDSVDVVLLDRRMPDVTGDEVLEAIREREYDCRVVMVTAVMPDFDILDMPFDDYLCKPVDGNDLRSAVEQQLLAIDYHDRVSEYFAITAKLSLIESEQSDADLEANEEYRRLSERADRLREDLEEARTEFDDFALAFQEIDRSA